MKHFSPDCINKEIFFPVNTTILLLCLLFRLSAFVSQPENESEWKSPKFYGREWRKSIDVVDVGELL